jgi:DNA-binding Lrp family transcriptional regulator
MLGNDARITNRSIARELKITQDVVHYRIKKLEKGGTIRRYTIDMDTSKLGITWCIALLRVANVDDALVKKLNDMVAFMPVSAYSVLTGEWNISIGFFGSSLEELYKIFKEIKKELSSDIIKAEPLIVTERVFKSQELL